MRTMLAGKIHRATVTEANVDYQGSVTLDPLLMTAAQILPFEQVHILDISNGVRLETYAIEGQSGSGEVCINGAAAHLVHEGDLVIILHYNTVSEEEAREMRPCLVYVDGANRILEIRHQITPPVHA